MTIKVIVTAILVWLFFKGTAKAAEKKLNARVDFGLETEGLDQFTFGGTAYGVRPGDGSDVYPLDPSSINSQQRDTP